MSLFNKKEDYLLTHNELGELYTFPGLSRKGKSVVRHQNLHLLNGLRTSESFGIPIIEPYRGRVDLNFKAFPERKKYKGEDFAIHFFVDDYKFEHILRNRFEKVTYELSQYGAVLVPDLSAYSDMPDVFIMHTIFMRQLYGAYWQQKCGFSVIPVVTVPKASLIDFALDGVPEYSVIGYCGNGHHQSKSAYDLWIGGLYEILIRKKPLALIIGDMEEPLPNIDIPVVFIGNHVQSRLRKL